MNARPRDLQARLVAERTAGQGETSPAPEAVMGKTRAEWEAEIRAEMGETWMRQHRGFLARDWTITLATFGD